MVIVFAGIALYRMGHRVDNRHTCSRALRRTHRLLERQADMTSTKRFDEIGKDAFALAGGKGANVGKLSRAGLPVPGEGLIGEPPIGSTRISVYTQI